MVQSRKERYREIAARIERYRRRGVRIDRVIKRCGISLDTYYRILYSENPKLIRTNRNKKFLKKYKKGTPYSSKVVVSYDVIASLRSAIDGLGQALRKAGMHGK